LFWIGILLKKSIFLLDLFLNKLKGPFLITRGQIKRVFSICMYTGIHRGSRILSQETDKNDRALTDLTGCRQIFQMRFDFS